MNNSDLIRKIIEYCDNDRETFVSKAFADGGLEPLFPRLHRAADNQASEGMATFSRYGIWANTVNDNIVEALSLLDTGDYQEARRLLRRSINSISAFAEIQALLGPKGMGRPTIDFRDGRG
ncbi:hypothetical protein ACFL1S_08500 [Pseudomonadota bacterium]